MDFDHKKQPRLLYHPILLWLVPLALIARVTVFVRQRGIREFASVDPGALIDLYAIAEIVVVGLGILAIFVSQQAKKALMAIRSSSLKFLLIYYIICLLSTCWSYFLSYTLFRSLEMIMIIVLISICMFYYEDFFSAEKSFLIISLFGVLFGIIMHLKLASFQTSLSRLHTNQYSAVAAMAFVYCLGERFGSDIGRMRYLTKLALIFGLFTILGTSASSNVAAFTGVLVVLLLRKKLRLEIIFCMLTGLFLLYWSGYFEGFWRDALFPGKTNFEIVTLKGRVYLWDTYMRLIAEQPVFGYGFATVSRMGRFWGTTSTTNTHNGFLEVMLSTGIIGGSFFLIWLIWLTREMFIAYRNNNTGSVGIIGAFTVGMINNLGRTMIGGSFDTPSAIFLVMIALFIVHVRVQSPSIALTESEHRKKALPVQRPRITRKRL